MPSPNIVTVPTEKMRNGDFSELLALGPQYQIYNPFTIRPHPTQAGRFTRDPFPGNIIPPSMIDAVAKNILGYFPLPNQAGTADGQQNFQNPTAVAFETYYTATGRVDHNISANHRIYGRFSWDFWEEEKDDRFDNIATGIFLNRKNRVLGLDDAYTFRNNLMMNVRGGFTRQMFPERRRSQGFDLSTLGFSPLARVAGAGRHRGVPVRQLRRVPGLRRLGVRRRLVHDRRLLRDRQPDVADRRRTT